MVFAATTSSSGPPWHEYRSLRIANVTVPALGGASPNSMHTMANMPIPTFVSAEEAALSSYAASAQAHVVRVEVIDDTHTDVIVDFEPSHPMRCHCELTAGGWVEAGDIVE